MRVPGWIAGPLAQSAEPAAESADGAGGVEGNTRLTAATGMVLFVLLAVEGVTLLGVRQLITLHIFVGVLLLGPVLLKSGTTLYRFARYYTGAPAYTAKGPPHPLLRVIGPFVMLSSLTLLGTGVGLIFLDTNGSGWLLTAHQTCFWIWVALMTVHVLGHLLHAAATSWTELRASLRGRAARARRWRYAAIVTALVIGVGAGAMLLPTAAPWTGAGRPDTAPAQVRPSIDEHCRTPPDPPGHRAACHHQSVTHVRPVLDTPRLLLVEDDRELGPLLAEVLGDDYQVEIATDGQRGLHVGLTRQYDAIVIDRGLPAIEGVDLVGRLRSRGVLTPILLLTARGSVAERVEGLDAGADDYLVKPFEVDELLARIRALLRRHPDTSAVVPVGSRSLQVEARTVVGEHAAPVTLSASEAELLAVLARRPDKVFTRPELLTAVFDPADVAGTVDTYVYYLRRKLGRRAIRTVYGVGYQLGML